MAQVIEHLEEGVVNAFHDHKVPAFMMTTSRLAPSSLSISTSGSTEEDVGHAETMIEQLHRQPLLITLLHICGIVKTREGDSFARRNSFSVAVCIVITGVICLIHQFIFGTYRLVTCTNMPGSGTCSWQLIVAT